MFKVRIEGILLIMMSRNTVVLDVKMLFPMPV